MPPRDKAKYEEFLRLWERRDELGLVSAVDFARVLEIHLRTAQRWVKAMRDRMAQASTNDGNDPQPPAGEAGEAGEAELPPRVNRQEIDEETPGEKYTFSPATPRRIALLKVLYDASGGRLDNPACLSRAELVRRIWEEGLTGDGAPSEDAIWRDLDALRKEGLVERVSRGGRARSEDTYRLNPAAFLQLPADLALEAASLARELEPMAPLSPFPETVREALLLLASPATCAGRWSSGRRIQGSVRPRRRLIKGRVAWERELTQRYVEELEAAARTGQQIAVEYEPPGGGVGEWIGDPLGVVYYWVLDAWYVCVRLVAWPESAAIPPLTEWGRLALLRLDRMISFRPTGERFTYPAGFSLSDYLAVPWGVELGEPFAVTVRFEDTFDVLTRVRQETAHRKARRLTPIPGGLIYQDVIAGPGEFLRWLRGFGSSAEVLAPDWLRERAREGAERLARLYEVLPPAGAEPNGEAAGCPARVTAPEPDIEPAVKAATRSGTESFAAVAASTDDEPGVVPHSPPHTGNGKGQSLHGGEPGRKATHMDGDQPAARVRGGQIRNALELLSLLATEGGITEGELLQRLHLSPRAFRDLMQELIVLGAPVYSPDESEDEDALDVLAGGEFVAARRWALQTDRAWLPPPRLTSLQVLAVRELARYLPPSSQARHRRVLEALESLLSTSSECETIRETDTGEDETGTSAAACGRFRVIKGVLDFYPDEETKRRVELLERAAGEARQVQVLYMPRDGREPVALVLEPLGVVFETSRFLWYAVARRAGSRGRISFFRVDRIHRCELRAEQFHYPSDFSLESYLASAWGVEVGAQPVPVVVRFWDEVNVLDKVRQQMRWRPQARLVKEDRPAAERPWGKAESYLYHDMVSGLNSFRRWLRSFGSSAEVLVPLELRQAMAEGAARLIALYCPDAVHTRKGDEHPVAGE
ncbi:MAG: WYL domain-containing protein [Limnochordales bacterium]|nr:WYL domain-containing protein [Limnochordales bacterium]